MSETKPRPCKNLCGQNTKTARDYCSNCKVECGCGCGERTKYRYVPGHAPEPAPCARCERVFRPQFGHDTDLCHNCRRAVREGRSMEMTEYLVGAHDRRHDYDGNQWCNGCKRYLSAESFGTCVDGGRVRTYARCKPCHRTQVRASKFRWKYNVSLELYDAVTESQGGVCYVCKTPASEENVLALDHDHGCCDGKKACGKCYRGNLCSSCNRGIGHLRDDVEALQRAIDYLQNPPAHAVIGKRVVPFDEEGS